MHTCKYMHFTLSSPVVCNAGIVPQLIFIIPYRDRIDQLNTYLDTMSDVMSNYKTDEYQIWIVHQCDQRAFNRGALKNLGFWICKQRYPHCYHNITLVFNDVDSVTSQRGLFQFQTRTGLVKHFYGFKYGLGGIFSITAGDFEKINGFPNFWGWGYEDNAIQHRVIRNGMKIDYTQFLPWKQTQYIEYGTPDSRTLLQNNDTDFVRQINRSEFQRYLDGTPEGIANLSGVVYDAIVSDEETEPNVVWMNVMSFFTGVEEDVSQRQMYDIRNGKTPFGKPRARYHNMANKTI